MLAVYGYLETVGTYPSLISCCTENTTRERGLAGKRSYGHTLIYSPGLHELSMVLLESGQTVLSGG